MSRRHLQLNQKERKKRKFMVVVDENPETEMAMLYAAERAKKTDADLVIVYIIEPAGFAHWMDVDKIMAEEGESTARDYLNIASEKIRNFCDIETETVILYGQKVEQIMNHIEKDDAIAILVLAASASKSGVGPLITMLMKGALGTFPVPITIVPGDLTYEEIHCLS